MNHRGDDDKFSLLESEIVEIIEQVRALVQGGLSQQNTTKRRSAERQLERMADRSNRTFKLMEDDAADTPLPGRTYLQNQIRSYRDELRSLTDRARADFKRQTENEQRKQLIGAASSADGALEADNNPFADDVRADKYRNDVLQGTAALHRASESMGRAMKAAYETEQVGNNVIGELGQQREQLHRVQDRVDDTNRDLTRSHRIMRSMTRRAATDKIFLMILILIEALILAAVVYFKWIR